MLKSIKTSVLAIILAGTAIISHAQKKVNEGKAVFTVVPVGSTDGIDQRISFSGNMIQTQYDKGPAKISLYFDTENKIGLFLLDINILQKQFAVKQSKTDIEKYEAELPKYSDFKATGEKKIIATFNAEKYTFKDDKGALHEVWATTDLDIPILNGGGLFKDLKALPVKYIAKVEGVDCELTLKSLTETKVAPISTAVPAGYDVMTFPELMDAVSKMRGGQ